MLTIRLNRVGKKNQAQYRVVVMDHKRATNARPVEFLGYYNPHKEKDQFSVDKERVEYWLSNGAQTTTTVASFLKKLGLKTPILIRKKKSSKTVAPKKEEVVEESKDAPAEVAGTEEQPKEEVKPEAKEEKKEEEKKPEAEEKKEEEKK